LKKLFFLFWVIFERRQINVFFSRNFTWKWKKYKIIVFLSATSEDFNTRLDINLHGILFFFAVVSLASPFILFIFHCKNQSKIQYYLKITLNLFMFFEQREILIYHNVLLYVEVHYSNSLFAMFNIAKLESHNWISVLIILLNAFVAVSPTNFSDRSIALVVLLSFLVITNCTQQVLHSQSERIVLEYSLFLLATSQLCFSVFLPTSVEATLHSPACKSISY